MFLILLALIVIIVLIVMIVVWCATSPKDIHKSITYYKSFEPQIKGDTCVNISSVNELECKIVNERFMNNVVNDTKTTGSEFGADGFNVSSSVSNNNHEAVYDSNTNGETNKYNQDTYFR